MNFATKTTRVHTGTFTADEIKAVTLSYATKQAGLDTASVASSKVDIAADGSVTVQLVEAPVTSAEQGEVEVKTEQPAAATAPSAPALHFPAA